MIEECHYGERIVERNSTQGDFRYWPELQSDTIEFDGLFLVVV